MRSKFVWGITIIPLTLKFHLCDSDRSHLKKKKEGLLQEKADS